jgi:hypothetical protein
MEKDMVLKSTAQIRVVLRLFYVGILPEYKAIPSAAVPSELAGFARPRVSFANLNLSDHFFFCASARTSNDAITFGAGNCYFAAAFRNMPFFAGPYHTWLGNACPLTAVFELPAEPTGSAPERYSGCPSICGWPSKPGRVESDFSHRRPARVAQTAASGLPRQVDVPDAGGSGARLGRNVERRYLVSTTIPVRVTRRARSIQVKNGN